MKVLGYRSVLLSQNDVVRDPELSAFREISLLKQLQHPDIVRCVSAAMSMV